MFEETMKEFKDKYWCLKDSDGVWTLDNHAFYLQTRKQIKQTKPIITITPFSVEEPVQYYQLLVFNVSQPKLYLNKLLDSGIPACSIKHGKFDFEKGHSWQTFDDGFSFVFHKPFLDQVCETYKIKKKQKREISEENRAMMIERMKTFRNNQINNKS